MAECTSVIFEDGKVWEYCWENTEIQPQFKSEDVDMGLRKGLAVEGQQLQGKAWRTCYYFLQGLSQVCTHWKESTGGDDDGTVASGTWYCSYDVQPEGTDTVDIPSGYNSNKCDNLGRRDWCNRYTARADKDIEEWVCIAPNTHLSGLGAKPGIRYDQVPILSYLDRESITGYNMADDGSGKGQCDCYGMGRGSKGCEIATAAAEGMTAAKMEERLSALPVLCNYYRPYAMGFGYKQPKALARTKGLVTEASIKDAYETVTEPLETRLPIDYEFFNVRARLQKCQWWDQDRASLYTIDPTTGLIAFAEEIGAEPTNPYEDRPAEPDKVGSPTVSVVTNCKHEYSGDVEKYRTKAGVDNGLITKNIWCKGGGPVCNGCRPECPGYSGKWIYLTYEKMFGGMPITANQLFELRFWAADWESQDQYDEYFTVRPNRDDPETASIFTYDRWKHKDNSNDPTESNMIGREFKMCMPPPLGEKEFIPERYINNSGKGAPITYASGWATAGTTAPEQVKYSNLIRWPVFPTTDPLSVLYPYFNDDVFDKQPCEDVGSEGHHKYYNTTYGDTIAVVGHTVRGRTVYVINESTGVSFTDGYVDLHNYNSILGVEFKLRPNVYSLIENVVADGLAASYDFNKFTTSDDIFGHFILPEAKLIQGLNRLFICVDFGDGSWEFRWRTVYSTFCGGLITQNDSTHLYQNAGNDGFRNKAPEELDPPPTMGFELTPLGASSALGFDTVVSYKNPISPVNYYSYSLLWIEEEITSIEDEEDLDGTAKVARYVSVGNSNLIWVDITDTDLNYLFEWEFVEATLNRIFPETEEGETEPEPVIVDLEQIDGHPSYLSIPPQACILKPKDASIRIRFFPSDWRLDIKYKYLEMRSPTQSDEILWGAGKTDLDLPAAQQFTITDEIFTANVTDITGTVGLMGWFSTPEGRLVAAMATKGIVQVVREGCRGVDIKYSYSTSGAAFELKGERSGWCTGDPSYQRLGTSYWIETPNCGDHIVNWSKWVGPMWFPYTRCRGYDLYDEFTICNNCQAAYVGPLNDGYLYPILAGQAHQRADYRYCGPYKYIAWGEGGRALTSCGCGCDFFYADGNSSDVHFRGYCKIRGPVDPLEYGMEAWEMPPFGNDGRELIEKFMSHEYHPHILLSEFGIQWDWAPMVIDNSALYLSFNAFEGLTPAGTTSYNTVENIDFSKVMARTALDPFFFVNQMTFFTSQTIGELLTLENEAGELDRYRWDEVFELQYEGNCTYPPVTQYIGNSTRTTFYTFIEEDMAWAWQEHWRTPDRNSSDESHISAGTGADGEDLVFPSGKLNFISSIENPKYVYSLYKEEHRMICDEGPHTILFRAPEDGTYAEVSLDDVNWRPFQILYDDYDTDATVTWINEGGDAQVGGSSDTDNIYEEAAGDDWLHDPDTLFEEGAYPTTSGAKNEGREVIVSEDEIETEYKYYNRGIIVRIPIRSLDFMPKAEQLLVLKRKEGGAAWEFSAADFPPIEVYVPEFLNQNDYKTLGSLSRHQFIWDDLSVVIPNLATQDLAIVNVIVRGIWGYDTGSNLEAVRPAVELIVATTDGETDQIPRGPGSGKAELVRPEKTQSLAPFEVKLNYSLGPVEMLQNKVTNFSLILTGYEGALIVVDKIQMTVSTGYEQLKAENIRTYERKYYVSRFGFGHDNFNINGPGDNLHFHKDMINSGQYFDYRGSFKNESITAYDKLRVVVAGIQHDEDTDVPITYNTLHEVESATQQDLYKDALKRDVLEDSYNYLSTTPPKVEYFLESINELAAFYSPLSIRSDKLQWDDHYLTKQFVQYEFWRPGGHRYEWSEDVYSTRCIVPGGQVEIVHQPSYKHVDHQGVGVIGAPDRPVDPAISYYQLRQYVVDAKYTRNILLTGEEPNNADLVVSGNVYNIHPD